MSIGYVGKNTGIFAAISQALSGMAAVINIAKSKITPSPWNIKSLDFGLHRQRPFSGSGINQRQLRKRARQGCKIRQECRLKQRRD